MNSRYKIITKICLFRTFKCRSRYVFKRIVFFVFFDTNILFKKLNNAVVIYNNAKYREIVRNITLKLQIKLKVINLDLLEA